jgi:hypothetical protein
VDLGWLAKAAGGEAWSLPFLQGPQSEVLVRDPEGNADPIDFSHQQYAFCSELVSYLLWVTDEKDASINKALYIACHPADGEYWTIARETGWRWFNSLRPSIPFFYFRSESEYKRLFLNPFERDFARKLDELSEDNQLVLDFLALAKLTSVRLEARMRRHMPSAKAVVGARTVGRQSVHSYLGFPRFPTQIPSEAELLPLPPEPWVYEALKNYDSADQEKEKNWRKPRRRSKALL